MRSLWQLATCVAFILCQVSALAQVPDSTPAQLTAADIYEQVAPSLCSVVATDGTGAEAALGSGFVVSENGDVVTNAHVVLSRPDIVLKCGEKTGQATGIRRLSRKRDLVQLSTSLGATRSARIAKGIQVKPGEPVYALGSPQGLEGTISSGIVSALRDVGGVRYLQISAPISHGSSGGPVVNGRGQVVGIATASLESGQSLNFAVAIAELLGIPLLNESLTELLHRDSQPLEDGYDTPVGSSRSGDSEYAEAETSQDENGSPARLLKFRDSKLGGGCRARVDKTPGLPPPIAWTSVLNLLSLPKEKLGWTSYATFESIQLGKVYLKAFYICIAGQMVAGGYVGTDSSAYVVELLEKKYGAATKYYPRSTMNLGLDEVLAITRGSSVTIGVEVWNWEFSGGGQIRVETQSYVDKGVYEAPQVNEFAVVYWYPEMISEARERVSEQALDDL